MASERLSRRPPPAISAPPGPSGGVRAYLSRRVDPLTSVFLVIPLFVVYQLGVLLRMRCDARGCSGVRNGADFVTNNIMVATGGSPGARSTGSRRSVASFSYSRRRARDLFSARDRDSPAVTEMPVGSCTSRTALAVLFRFCPPGPGPRNWSQRHWASSASSDRSRVEVEGTS